jgi:hypothetical protein
MNTGKVFSFNDCNKIISVPALAKTASVSSIRANQEIAHAERKNELAKRLMPG